MLKVILMLVLFAAINSARGEQGKSAPHGLGPDQPRSSYDPMVHGAAQPQKDGLVGATLQQINPQDKDYGAELNKWRIAAVEETVDNFYHWAFFAVLALLGMSMAGIWWLIRERDTRLNISADVFLQIYNAHIGSRQKALSAIAAHNRLVDLYNTKCDEIAGMRSAASQAVERRNRKGTAEVVGKLETPPPDHVVSDALGGDPNSEDRPALAVSQGVLWDTVGGEPDDTAQLRAKVRSLEVQKQAQSQKISNLRTQLNRAHDSFQQQRGQVPSSRQS